MARFWKIYRTLLLVNIKECTRDLLPIVFSLGLPLFFLISYGIAKKESGQNEAIIINVAVTGDRAQAETLVQRLQAEPAFHVAAVGQAEPAALLNSNKYQVVIATHAGEKPHIFTSAAWAKMSSLLTAALNSSTAAGNLVSAPQVQTIDAAKTTSLDYAFASILTLSLLQIAVFGTAAPVIAAKEKGLYRLFQLVPMPRSALLGAQVSVRFLFSLVQLILLLAVALLVFNVPVVHPFMLLALTPLAALTLVCYGYAIAGFFNRMGVASGFLMLLNFYCVFFGQLFNDLSDSLLRWLVYTTPVGFIAEGLRYAAIGYSSLFSVSAAITGMLLFLILSVWTGVRFFNFEPKKH